MLVSKLISGVYLRTLWPSVVAIGTAPRVLTEKCKEAKIVSREGAKAKKARGSSFASLRLCENLNSRRFLVQHLGETVATINSESPRRRDFRAVLG